MSYRRQSTYVLIIIYGFSLSGNRVTKPWFRISCIVVRFYWERVCWTYTSHYTWCIITNDARRDLDDVINRNMLPLRVVAENQFFAFGQIPHSHKTHSACCSTHKLLIIRLVFCLFYYVIIIIYTNQFIVLWYYMCDTRQ